MIIPMFSPAGAGGLTSLSFVTSDTNTSTSGDVTLPAGLSGTDLLIYLEHRGVKTPNPTAAYPTGFTPWINLASGIGFGRVLVSYKIAETGDSSSTISPQMTGTPFAVGQSVLVYRADATINTITASTPSEEVTGGNPSSQTILAASADLPLVAIAVYFSLDSLSAVSPRTFSPAEDAEINVSNGSFGYWKRKLYNSSPSNITVDMDDEGNGNALASGYLSAA